MMSKYSISFFVTTILITFVTYYVSNNLFTSLLILILYFAYFVSIYILRIRKYCQQNIKKKECISFVNKFLYSYMENRSINKSFEFVYQSASKDFKRIYDGVTQLKEEEKLEYFSNYFPYNIYYLFINVIKQNKEENLINVYKLILDKNNSLDESITYQENSNRKSVIEFIILWTISLLVLLVLRVALNDFYFKFYSSYIFQISLIVFFFFILISIHVLIIKITKMEVS